MKKPKDAPPAFVAGGNGCGCLWVVTPDRRLWTWSPRGRSPIGDTPVPGVAGIAALDLANLTAVLDDGSRFAWLGRWTPFPGLLDSTGTVRVRCVQGIALGGGRDIHPGDEVDLPEAEARALIARGVVVGA